MSPSYRSPAGLRGSQMSHTPQLTQKGSRHWPHTQLLTQLTLRSLCFESITGPSRTRAMAADFQRDRHRASLPQISFTQDEAGSCHRLQSLPQHNRARKLVCAHRVGMHRPTHPFGKRAAASQGKLSPTVPYLTWDNPDSRCSHLPTAR